MPEGHTIHRLARQHQTWLAGQRLRISSPQGRFEDGAQELDGLEFARADAVGKHLFHHFAEGAILHIHLGLFGRFRKHASPPPEPRGQVRIRYESAQTTLDLSGPNQCELITESQRRALRKRLGPDPLRPRDKPASAWERIARSRQAIGLLLMDQHVIAGIGNIYRTELLYLCNLNPLLPGRDVPEERFIALWHKARELMKIGVRTGRIITADPKALGKSASKLNRDERLNIFKRKVCGVCRSRIRQIELAGRKAFYCPKCQPA